MRKHHVMLTIDGFKISKDKTIPYNKVILYTGDSKIEIIPEIESRPNHENLDREIQFLKGLNMIVESRNASLIARELF
jgi:hypothetical protein